MRSARIFFFDVGDAHDSTYMMIAAVDRNDGPEQHQGVDAIRLHPARTAVYLKAGRIQYPPERVSCRASQNPS